MPQDDKNSSEVPDGESGGSSSGGDNANPESVQNIESLKEDEALVEVSTGDDGERSVSLSFKTTEEFAAEFEKRRLERSETIEEQAREKFKRKVATEEETIQKFKELGNEWFALAIGFLKVVPDLTDRNFVYVKDEVAASVQALAEGLARSKEEIIDDVGRPTSRYIVGLESLPIIVKKMGRSMETMGAASALARSSLGALVSDYEALVSNLLRALSGLRQGILISDDDSIKIGSLTNFSTFDEVIDDLIDDKIQEILQARTHLQVIKWIEEKCGVNLTSDKILVREFVEICQRRNLLIHAGGRANKKYHKICAEEGWELADLPKIGETVGVSRRYLRRATARVFLVGFLTLHIVWQKTLPKNRTDSLEQLLTVSHDFVDNGLTKMCRRICVFALASEKHMSAKHKAYFNINLAQSYLFDPALSDEEKANQVSRVIKSCDWSMAPPVVQFAIKCLKRDFSDISDSIDRAVADGLTYSQAMTWSVFREARGYPEFLERFNSSDGSQETTSS